MNSHTALRIIVGLLYILGSALNLVWLVSDWHAGMFDPFAWAYLPVNIVYLVGGFYVLRHIDSIARFRSVLIRALIALFGIDVFYAAVSAFVAIKHPSLFSPPADASADVIIGSTAAGLGISLLILLAVIHLINRVSGVAAKKPSIWLTTIGWIVIAAMIAGVAFYGLSE